MLVCVFDLVVCYRTVSNINVFCYIFGEVLFCFVCVFVFSFSPPLPPLSEGLKLSMISGCVVLVQKLPFFGGWHISVSMWTSGVSCRQFLSSQIFRFQSDMQFILPNQTCSSFCAHQQFFEL
jgi:hypothetical protein